MQNRKSLSPNNRSVIVRLKEAWKCIICDALLSSDEQLKVHVDGKRHAANAAHKEARGSERWTGDPYYSNYNFWTAVRELIPEYPSVFPTEAEIATASDRQVFPSSNQAQDGDLHSTFLTGSSVCMSVLGNDRSQTSDGFFQSNYQSVLPIGEFYCELCHIRFPERIPFIEHLATAPHKIALNVFERVEADYFQPVRYGSAIVFMGLSSKSVIVSDKFYVRKQKALEVQWAVAGRIPKANSVIMQSTPRDLVDVLTDNTIHDI